MITLHRLGHATKAFHLNRDMIVAVEANPDTVITLTTGDKIVVAETPDQVAEKVRDCRVDILTFAMRRRRTDRAAPIGTTLPPAGAPNLIVVEPVAAQSAGQGPVEP